MGRVLPMTTSGLEYFVDVMVELALRQDGFDTRRVATVVKSNASDLPIGMEFVDPTFADLLACVGVAPQPAEVADVFPAPALPAPAPTRADALADLLAHAESVGLDRPRVLLAARHYCGVASLEDLTGDQADDLLARLRARYDAPEATGDSAALDAEPEVRVSRRRAA